MAELLIMHKMSSTPLTLYGNRNLRIKTFVSILQT